jgi:putative oxygen-independent coproporphyrinogen III oxidase
MSRVIPISSAQQPKVGALADIADRPRLSALPPLSVYVHVPWCVRKCPYCDFNSHEQPAVLPEDRYLDSLQADLEQALPEIWGRQVHTVFIGGGTPSLLSAPGIERLLTMLRSHLNLWPDAEITLEANPGTAEAERFMAYAASGVNRISLGIQSFDEAKLLALGRVHNAAQARAAIEMAQRAVGRVNLDLMFALPQQTLAQCEQDAREALSFGTEHLSMYHLTFEPNTVFAKYPPVVPDDELACDMQEVIVSLAQGAGFERYEVSAFAKPGARARHNVNYWEFGDYLGLGPGAHGKLSFHDRIERQTRQRNPENWMRAALARDGSHVTQTRQLKTAELPFEFMLNALRLEKGVAATLYTERCGLPIASMNKALLLATQKGLLLDDPLRLQATEVGWRLLNELQALFL